MNFIKNVSLRFTLVFIYLIFGILWIEFSDNTLVYFVHDVEHLTTYQSYKGWVFILLTTVLLYILLLMYDKKTNSTIQSKNQIEKKFNLLYKDAPNPYQSLDSDGNILAVNQKWLDLLGYQREEVIGHWFGDILTPQSLTHFKSNFVKFKAEGSINGVMFDMLHKDKTIVPILLHGQITYDVNHELQTHCSFQDISNRRKVEHLNKVLKLIRDVNQAIVRIKDNDELLQESCNILMSTNLYNNVSIEITQNNLSKFYHALPQAEQLTTMQQETSKENVHRLELYYDNLLYGYMTVSSFSLFDTDELTLFKELADDIAYGIFHIKTEQDLKNNEERYRFVIEGATDGLWDWNLLTNEVYYSPRWKEIFGFHDDELENSIETWENRLHPDDKDAAFLAVQMSHEGKRKRYQNIYRLKHKDGHWIWIETRGQTIFDKDGKAVRMIGFHTDITELKKSEYKLQISNEKFEKAFNYTPSIIIISHFKTGVIYDVNETFLTIFGYEKEDVIGKTTFELELWRDIEDRKRYIATFDKYGQVDNAVYDFNSKNKKLITTKLYASLVTIDHEEYILAVAEDVTERNRLYDILQKSQEQAKLGSWERTSESEELFWSHEVYTIFERDNKEVISYKQFLEASHPDDRNELLISFKRSIERHKKCYLEHRLLFPDGRIKYVVERAEHFYDKNNKYVRSVGTIQDITEKKVLEQELEKSYKTLQKLTENIPGAIYQYQLHPDGRSSFPYASKGIKNIYGISPEDVVENSAMVFKNLHPDDLAMIEDSIQDSAQTMTEWNLEYRVNLPEKGTRWLQGKAKPEKLEDGSVLWHGFITDITNQLLAEQEIKKRETLFTSVFQVIPDFLFIIDENGTIIDYRAQKENDFYVQPELFIGKCAEDILPSDVGKLFKTNIESLSENFDLNIFRYELEIEGKVRHYEARMARLPIDNTIMTIIRDVSEQISYEQKLVFQSQLLEQSLAATSVIDEDSHISYVNNAFLKMWGYDEKEEILGTYPSRYCVDSKIPQKIIKKVEKEGQQLFLFKAKRKDETLFDALMAVQYLHYMGKNHYLSSTMDITKQQENLKQLQQKRLELETIIQDAPNPMMLHDETGKILMLNQAWINSSGFSLEETPTIDKWIECIYKEPKTKIAIKEHINSLYGLTEKLEEGNFTFLNKNQDLVTWQFSSAPLGVIDGKRTVISSAMDITELKRKDEILINQSRHAAMGEMISMIAHQWRQPLSTINMDVNNVLLDIAVGKLNSSAVEECANSIAKRTEHLSQTIDDFRNFFKPDKVISKVNLQDIFNQTLSIVKDSLVNNNINLTSSFETKEEVEAYPRELMQVFVNMITNSKDALVSNNIKDALINVRIYENKKYVNTEISDNGGGIAADVLPKVFDPYFSTKDEKTGTGLGLYMSKMIVEDHLHGILEVHNTDNGACFTVSLLKEKVEKE